LLHITARASELPPVLTPLAIAIFPTTRLYFVSYVFERRFEK
jgi:hypothetical protein